MKSLMMYTSHALFFFGGQTEKNEMGGECSTYGGE